MITFMKFADDMTNLKTNINDSLELQKDIDIPLSVDFDCSISLIHDLQTPLDIIL